MLFNFLERTNDFKSIKLTEMSTADILPCSSMSYPHQQQNPHHSSSSSTSSHHQSSSSSTKVSRKSSTKSYDTKAIGNTVANGVALVIIQQLQHWCYQLFWLTIVCVMGCCGDLEAISNKTKTLQDVRKSIATVSAQNSIKRSKSVLELEMQ
uniref:Uncharacterized protein n=1 Tax=Panagrolaimus sp. ES5 TaxID=591445 RepID=A0AC34G7P4_9BILA